MDKLILISGALFLASDLFAMLSVLLPDWIVSDVMMAGETRFGLIQSCITLYGRNPNCFIPEDTPKEWIISLSLIIIGILFVSLTIGLLIMSGYGMRHYILSYARWTGFTGMCLFCVAGVIIPMGFYDKKIGGEAYQLPSSFQVGVSYIFFVLAIWMSVVSELFAGKVCMPHF